MTSRVDRVLSSDLLARLIMLLAAGLRVWQYAGNPPLSIDEIALGRNIIGHSLARLLTAPLDYSQVAPRGFLLAEKAAVSALGPSEYALRLVPLLCALASVFLFWRVARRVLDRVPATVALVLFAVGSVFVVHGAEVKQYSADVAAALLLTAVALDLRAAQGGWRHWLAAGLLGAATVWFSQAAVLVAAGLGGVLLWFAVRDRDRAGVRGAAVAVGLWAASAAAVTVVSVRSMPPETRAYMHRFWHNAFMPLPPRTVPEGLWIWNRLSDVFGRNGLAYPWPGVAVAVMAWGFVILWRHSADRALLLLAPVLVTLAAAASHQYPFADRVILFLTPAFLLALAATVGRIYAVPRIGRAIAGGLVATPIVATAIDHPPYVIENTAPMFAYLQAHRRTDDAIYVYYGAWQAYRYYGPRYGFGRSAAAIGACHRGDPQAYVIELSRLRGRPRAWIVFSHALRRLGEQPLMLDYLNRVGHRLDQVVFPDNYDVIISEPETAVLFDLSDTTLLSPVTTAAYLAARSMPIAAHGFFATGVCDRGPQVPVQDDSASGDHGQVSSTRHR